MRYVSYIISLFLYSTVITQTSLSLGLTHTAYDIPEIQGVTDPTLFEGLLIAVQFLINNLSAFLQLVTLQADIPIVLALIFAGSLGLGVLVVIVLIIRGVS